MNNARLLINGRLVTGDSSAEVINPATGQAFAHAPVASRNQLDLAVQSARAAMPVWREMPIHVRRESLIAVAALLESNADALARLLTMEQGKPLVESRREVTVSASFFRALASLDFTTNQYDSDGRRIWLRRRPLGVAAAIVPWNFPLVLMSMKVPAALLAGNTVILKPSPTTPLSTLMIGQLIAEVLPAGVLNIINGAPELGAWITAHAGIDKISFTGSTETGIRVMAGAATSLKRITLELGGNDPAIVLDDADPKAIAPALFASAFQNNGQTCIAIKRLYVHDRLYDAVCDELVAIADQARIGDGMNPVNRFGPVQNEIQYRKVLEFIEEGKLHGNVAAGGYVPDGPGFFIRPTIVRDIVDGNRLVDEEQFGPVLPIMRFDNIDDVVARANRSPHGLGSSVWSCNAAKAHDVAIRLEAGTVWINKHGDLSPDIPFGGARMSGIGTELGPHALDEFSQLHVINANAPAT
ncbi:aldehyde dehydrogenase family protein [Paraburkholderia graminis]|uniref:aldehyde dehydrogenase family protein n=1 Tax=Paraburkholderia graminis TaxID=60548 RepID=UPI0038BAF9E1